MSQATISWMRRVGISLMAAALATATAISLSAPATAQESGPPEEAEETEVTRSGFYDAPLTEVIPPSVLKQFPPQAVCLVVVKACSGDFHDSQPDGVKEGYNEFQGEVKTLLDAIRELDPHEPESPLVRDGTLPVSVTTGQPRYRSAVAFELPSVPEGHQVDDFRIYLTQTDPSGGASSPTVRQAVLAALTCAREDPESPLPEDFPQETRRCQQDQFEKIIMMGCEGERTDGPNSCPAEQQPLQIEMCPLLEDWEEGRSQDPDTIPPTDCFLGANGRLLEDGETWEFDLTFALDAWANGEIENYGVLIAPQGAPNFAHGDPDSTFNKQVTFSQEIVYVASTSEEIQPAGDFGGEDDFSRGGDLDTASGGSSDDFSAPSGGSSGNMSSFSSPANDDEPVDTEPEPEVAAGEGGGGGPEAPATEPVAAGEEEPGSAWYTWLLAPVFLGGMWLTAQSLTAAPTPAAASRGGAMTRLIEQQQRATSAVSGPQLA